jgi:hypothetical protein
MRPIALLMASLIVFSTNISGQGDEKGKKPEKVSSAMMQEETTDATNHEAGHEGDRKRPRTQSRNVISTLVALQHRARQPLS